MIHLTRINLTRFLIGSVCALLLAGMSSLAGAASSKAPSAKISGYLTEASFSSAQVGSVRLIYKFSAPSKSFSCLLTFRKGSEWKAVKSVTKTGSFKGSKSMTVKKVFGGKAVKLGTYRLKLSADGGSKLLSFDVVASAKPAAKPSSGGSTGGGTTRPLNTSLPAITGTVKQGDTLTVSNGSWKNSPTSFAYQWLSCDSSGNTCADVSGASSSSYVVQAADIGRTIRVAVTASNSYGSGFATSNQTAVVISAWPLNTALPVVTGTAKQGDTLTASDGSWDNSPTSYKYQWQRCDSSGESCSDISFPTTNSYILALDDIGSTIRFVVKASNEYGYASATSAQTAVVQSSPGLTLSNPVPLGQPGIIGGGGLWPGTWSVTVTGVYPDATSAVLAADPSNTAPPPGYQDYMIAVSATYTGPGSSNLDSSYGMRAMSAWGLGNGYNMLDHDCGVLPNTDLEHNDPAIPTGGTESGYAACWQVLSSDASSLEMYVELPYPSNSVTWFALS